MIPLWMISLLSINGVGEFSFSYNEEQKIFIDGKRIDGEWVVNIHVSAMPYFAWGCNKYHTKMKASHKEVVRYYLTLVLNQLSEYRATGRDKLIRIIKSNLENS